MPTDPADPLTHEAAWQQAVVTAAAALQRQYPGARLRQAQDLVLARAVLVSPDGVATVRSGTRRTTSIPRVAAPVWIVNTGSRSANMCWLSSCIRRSSLQARRLL
jgi:hypothetical protein